MKKIKKKYHLRKEVKEFLRDILIEILGILVFIGIILSLMILHLILFG